MKYIIIGNQLCVTKDDFVNLQESRHIFIPLESETAKIIQTEGFFMLPLEDLRELSNILGVV